MARRTKTQPSTIQNVDSREIWECVRRLTGKKRHSNHVTGVVAESLNDHYCKIFTDPSYTAPPLKLTVNTSDTDCITE